MRLARCATLQAEETAGSGRLAVRMQGGGWVAAAIAAAMLLPVGCRKSTPAAESAATSPAAPVAAVPAAPANPVAPVPAAARVPVTLPTVQKNLYPPIADARKDIAAGIAEARRTHRRVILDFGGDWCPDCQVLDIYFHQPPNAALLARNFVKVNINIGRMDANLDVAHKYGVPVQGVPALAVLDGNGKLLYAQNKEFDDMRSMQPSSVTEFLNKWKR